MGSKMAMRKRPEKAEYLVFVSHSTKDRFIARQMARLIQEKCARSGVRAYLDERDIETGESIHGSVRNNIRKCDEFLVLLSKQSIDRQWVLSELGAAWVLEKRIVAVVDNLTLDEMPEIIVQYKWVDLNKFEDYVQDLRQRARRREGNHAAGNDRRELAKDSISF